MKKTHNHLLRAVLETNDLAQLRNRSFERMLKAGRARRQRSQLAWACLCVAVAMLWVSVQWRTQAPAPTNSIAASAPAALPAPPHEEPERAEIQFISTEELLALFPDRPRALIGPPGQQQFVLLDEPLAGQ